MTSWRDRLRLAKATAQAWNGDLLGAEATLGSVHGLESSPQSLDLLARIRAQQGRLGEAQSLWAAASDLEPDNPSYRAAARLAKVWERLHVRPDRVRILSVVAAAVLLLFVASALWRNSRMAPPAAGPPSTAEVAASAPPNPTHAVPPSLASSTPAASQAPAATTAPRAVHLSGAVTRQEGDATVVLFEDGLFAAGAALTPAAERILDQLAANLRNQWGAVAITGHTDDLPVRPGSLFRDNVSLGFARAVAVAERLRTVAGLDAGTLQLRSLGAHQPPFPNDSPEGRQRNRTVVIRISPGSVSQLGAR